MKKEIGIVGLGKMGAGIVRHLMEQGWTVRGYDYAEANSRELAKEGMKLADSPTSLVEALPSPKVVWLMVPARASAKGGKAPVDEVLFGENSIERSLRKGDIVIDGGNSFYKEDIPRAQKLAKRGVLFVDVGFSGGPSGARHGGCLMIGGNKKAFRMLEPLFKALALPGGYQFFEGAGAGHFVKMVHNGIEYGMMQAIAEGFAILKKSKYKPDLVRVTDIYQHGSVVESRLVGWLKSGFEAYGEDLKAVSGSVGHTGEGEWTAKTARELKIPANVIAESFEFRVRSAKKPSYIGKLVAVIRNQFGGHSIERGKMT